jgi:ubiquinol-cytochrome c reductase cytochrome b subunit
MNKSKRNEHPLFKIANDALVGLPTPSTIRGWWNSGSLLGICLVAQIVTGLFLAIHYCPNIDTIFSRLKTYLPIPKLWMTTTYATCKRCIALLRLYLPTYRKKPILRIIQLYAHMIYRGNIIPFLTTATAFIGYVLPCAELSVVLYRCVYFWKVESLS